jgi:prenyltransferase beta subunit
LIAVLAYWVVEQTKKKEDVIITTQIMPEEEEPLDVNNEVSLIKEKAEVTIESESVLPHQITTEEVSEHNETDNNMESQTAEGTTEGISDSPQVGSGLMGNIGGGGGGGGSFGQRSGGGKKKAVMRGGGSKATESAVDWALWWLANHQEKDGHWDSAKYEGGKGNGDKVDVAVTGAALLAFLGAGHSDKAGKWKLNVKNAISWLIENQRPNGSWDDRNYTNGICTMALAEAAGMGCGGTQTKKSAELAVDYLLKQQNENGGFDYTGPSKKADISVTGWCIMGLKSAILAGIKEKEIKEAFHKCGELLNTYGDTKDNTSTTKGNAWYDTNGQEVVAGSSKAGGACQAIAMLVRQYLGWARSEPWLEAAADGQITKIPIAYAGSDVYRIYYSFLTLFQQGGKHWKAWNEPVSKMIVAAQRQDGDFKGSWDKNGCVVDHGGRVLYTALLCLSLEIYYRYESVMK